MTSRWTPYICHSLTNVRTCAPAWIVWVVVALAVGGVSQFEEALVVAFDRDDITTLGFVGLLAVAIAFTQLACSMQLDRLMPPADSAEVQGWRFAQRYVPVFIGLTLWAACRASLTSLLPDNVAIGFNLLFGASVALLVLVHSLEASQDAQQAAMVVGALVGFIPSPLWGWMLLTVGIAALEVRRGLASDVVASPSTRPWRGLALVCACAFVIAGIYLATRPFASGGPFGTALVLGLGLLFWAALALILSWARARVPSAVTKFVWAYVGMVLLVNPFNVDEVRTLPVVPADAAGQRAVSKYAAWDQHSLHWLEARRAEIEASERYSVLFVAAPGGGIRAALWTALSLSSLDDATIRHTAAISGVSGGSVGAAVFAALVASNDAERVTRSEKILSADLLSPVAAGTLLTDPLRMFAWLGDADRGRLLERGLELAWRNATGGDQMGERMADLWQGPRSLQVPVLYLNTTDADTGERLTLEGLWHGRSLRLSTAAVLSARFPLVSPMGRVAGDEPPRRLVDGGYFDNTGTVALADKVQRFLVSADEAGLADRIRPVVLMLDNGPEQPPSGPSLTSRAFAHVRQTVLGAALAPVVTLSGVRTGRDTEQVESLQRLVRRAGGCMYRWRLRADETARFPLGWTLAQSSVSAMTRQVAQDTDRRSPLLGACAGEGAP